MTVYLTTFLAVAVLTHLCLFAVKAYITEEYSLKRLWSTTDRIYGLMAAMVSMAVVSLVQSGVHSSAFRMSGVVAAVVIVLGIKLTSWRPARLPMLSIDGAFSSRIYKFSYSWAGSIAYGLVFGFLVTIPRWSRKLSAITDVPSKGESRVYLYIFGAIIVLSLFLFWRLRKGALRRLPTARRLRRVINNAWFVPALIGLCIALIQNQTRNVTLANRYLVLAVFAFILLAELWAIIIVLPNAGKSLRAERTHFEKQQRVSKRKKRKRR